MSNLQFILFSIVWAILSQLSFSIDDKNWDLIYLLKKDKDITLSNEFTVVLKSSSDYSKMFLTAKTIFPDNTLPETFMIISKLRYLNRMKSPGTIISITDPDNKIRLALTLKSSPGVIDKIALNIILHPINGVKANHDILLPFTKLAVWTFALSMNKDKIIIHVTCEDTKRPFGYQFIKIKSSSNETLFKDGAILHLFNAGNGRNKFTGEVFELMFSNNVKKLQLLCPQPMIDGSGSPKNRVDDQKIGNFVLNPQNLEPLSDESENADDVISEEESTLSNATITKATKIYSKTPISVAVENRETNIKKSDFNKEFITTERTDNVLLSTQSTESSPTSSRSLPSETKTFLFDKAINDSVIKTAMHTRILNTYNLATDTTNSGHSSDSNDKLTTSTTKRSFLSLFDSSFYTKVSTPNNGYTNDCIPKTKYPSKVSQYKTESFTTPISTQISKDSDTESSKIGHETTDQTTKRNLETTDTKKEFTFQKPRYLTNDGRTLKTDPTSVDTQVMQTTLQISDKSTTESPRYYFFPITKTSKIKKDALTNTPQGALKVERGEMTITANIQGSQPATTTQSFHIIDKNVTQTQQIIVNTTTMPSTIVTKFITENPQNVTEKTTIRSVDDSGNVRQNSSQGSEYNRCKVYIDQLLNMDNCEELKKLRLSKPKPGEKGAKGAVGERGEKGNIGPQGLPGTCSKSQCPTITNMTRIKGDKGDSGVCEATLCSGIKGNKGDRGAKGTPGIKGEIGSSSEINVELIKHLVTTMIPSEIESILKNVKGAKGDPGECKNDGQTSRKVTNGQRPDLQENINIGYGSLVFENRESLEKVSFHLPLGSMAFLLKSDSFLVKVDHLNNIWRSITLESRSRDWLLPMYRSTPKMESQRPVYANSNAKKLYLVALSVPTMGDLKSMTYQPGGYSGAAFQCQQNGDIYGYGRLMHPLINTDMFNMKYVIHDSYKSIPIYNSRDQLLANDFSSLLSIKYDLQNEILDFDRKSISENIMASCVWIGKDPNPENPDYQQNAKLKCNNWMTRHPTSRALTSLLTPLKPLLSEDNIKPRACSLQCYILCIQTEPHVS